MIITQLQIQFIYHFQQEISKINILSQGYETHSISVFSATITSYDMLQMFTYTLLKKQTFRDTCAEIPHHCSTRFTWYLADSSLNIVLQFLYLIKIVSINSLSNITKGKNKTDLNRANVVPMVFQFCVKDIVLKMCRLTKHSCSCVWSNLILLLPNTREVGCIRLNGW